MEETEIHPGRTGHQCTHIHTFLPQSIYLFWGDKRKPQWKLHAGSNPSSGTCCTALTQTPLPFPLTYLVWNLMSLSDPVKPACNWTVCSFFPLSLFKSMVFQFESSIHLFHIQICNVFPPLSHIAPARTYTAFGCCKFCSQISGLCLRF